MTEPTLHFTKMHGLGNDFMVIYSPHHPFNPDTLPISTLANRHLGVGFDQLLAIEPSRKADYFCRIFNADGSEAEQCGNGLRCVARYLHEQVGAGKNMTIETKAGIYPVTIQDYQHIRVSMGAPQLKEKLTSIPIASQSSTLPVSILSIGNPHAIVKVPSTVVEAASMVAEDIAAAPFFKDGANVGFMQILDPHHILLRTFERGAGETHACGSNACAAVVAGISNGWLQSPVDVRFKLGSLQIEWSGDDNVIHMTGPADLVYHGNYMPLTAEA